MTRRRLLLALPAAAALAALPTAASARPVGPRPRVEWLPQRLAVTAEIGDFAFADLEFVIRGLRRSPPVAEVVVIPKHQHLVVVPDVEVIGPIEFDVPELIQLAIEVPEGTPIGWYLIQVVLQDTKDLTPMPGYASVWVHATASVDPFDETEFTDDAPEDATP